MPARLHPGVYVEEVSSGARAIEAAGTSTAIFVGDTERGPLTPTRIKGVADFERQFGGFKRHAGAAPAASSVVLRYAVDAFFRNGGTSAYVLRALTNTTATPAKTGARASLGVVASSPGAWSDNLGVVLGDSSDGDATRFRLFVVYTFPGTSDGVIVERWDRLSANPSDENYAKDVLLRSSYLRWQDGPVVKPAGPADVAGANPLDTAIVASAATHRMTGGTQGNVDFPNGNLPGLLSALDEITDASLLVVPAQLGEADNDVVTRTQAALDYATGRPRQDLFCIADMPRSANKSTTEAASATVAYIRNAVLTTTNFGGVYFPWIEISDPAGVGRDPTLVIGPSSFVAGIYARIDQKRGVWKAPAGLEATVLNSRRLDYNLLDAHQDDLNPLGINGLRAQPGGGNVVWGARTMQPGSEWRYVPVRRTAIFLRTSIYNGIQWAVFEPNDEPLWAQLRLTIGGFMEQLFRQGAFAGRTTREAFFVKCDAETTPEADQIAGIVNVSVGFAPLRPAEFVVVRLSQIVNQKA
ncbi:phage tail sheath subtilisin-like domain-containing protein [Corallococcus sp. EGB]|uniref:phage tail sheath family protein n=1 Tax=Corallococcus sp. EGB TaxID=1521117 RepID=UPI001CBB5AA4|nr:phage tail sheath subtilisin-like domain-containing protein [Corallococcus sp. EGB]